MNFQSGGKLLTPIFQCSTHTHKTWELIYQCSGNTCATVGREKFPMQEGELIVIPPEMPHNTASDSPITDMHIILAQCDFPHFPFVIKDTDGTIRTLFDMTLAAYHEKSDNYELITEKLSELICLYIKKATHEQKCPLFIINFKSTLVKNIEICDFNVTECIEKSGYHADYFRRVFKKHTSMSPLSYLNHLRMEHAKELLLWENFLSVKDVAERCGFKDSLYFSTCFKRQVGLSPLAFRKKHL